MLIYCTTTKRRFREGNVKKFTKVIKTPTTQETECSSTLTHVSSCWTLASKGLAQELQEVICPNVQTTNIISISVSSTWTTLKSQRTRKQPGCCCCCSPGSTVEQHDKLFINHVRQPLDKIKVVAQTMCVNPWTERSRYMMRPPTRPRLCCLIGIKIDQHERELKIAAMRERRRRRLAASPSPWMHVVFDPEYQPGELSSMFPKLKVRVSSVENVPITSRGSPPHGWTRGNLKIAGCWKPETFLPRSTNRSIAASEFHIPVSLWIIYI